MGISSISNSDWSVYLQQYAATKASQTSTIASQTDATGISRSSGNLANVVATSADGDTFQLSPEAVSAADMFNKMDTDSDGSLSQSEFIAARPSDVTEEMAKNLYNSFDSDTSGSLSETEYTTAMNNAPPPPPSNAAADTSSSTDSQSFDSLDTNKDGVVSMDELLAARPDDVSEEMAAQLFSTLDTDKSGDLSASELAAMSAGKDNSSVSAVSSASSSSNSQSFDSLDTNKDGVVSIDELLAARPDDVSEEMAAQLFSTLDTDKSGDLSSTELANMSKNAAASGVSAV